MLRRIASCTLLLCALASAAFAQTASAPEGASDTVLRDRYLQMALRNPRRGTAAEKLYQLSAQSDGINALIAKIRQQSSPPASIATLIGLMEEMRGHETEALAAYTEAGAADAKAFYPRFAAGVLLLHRSDYAGAIANLQSAIDTSPEKEDALEARKTLGRAYLRSRQMDKAREVWSALAEMAPTDTVTLQELTSLLTDEEQWEEALKHYARLRDLQKDQPYQAVVTTVAMGTTEARRGQFDAALKRYEEALDKTKPDSWLADEIRQRIEELFRKRSDLSGLATYYEAALKNDPSDVRTTVLYAQLLVELDKRDEARKAYDKALEFAPTDARVRVAMIRQLELANDYAGAIRHYEKLLEHNPKDVGYLEELGATYVKQANNDEGKAKARTTWQKIVDLNPKDSATMVQVAGIFLRHNMMDDADRYYAKAVELSPDVGQYREYYGEFLVDAHQRDKALTVLRGMTEGPRGTVQSWMRLASVLQHFGFNDEALSAAREAVKVKPDHFDARMLLTRHLGQQTRIDEALAELDQAAQLAANDFFGGQVVDERIRLLGGAGKLQEVYEKRLTEFAAAPPSTAAPWVETAKMAVQLNQIPAAVEHISKALSKSPDAVAILELAASIYQRANDNEKIIETLKRLVQLAPQNRSEYQQQLASRYAALGDREEAIKAAEAVIAANADNPAGYELLSNLCERFGVADRSLKALKDAIKVAPKNTELRMQYARRLERNGEIDSAMEEFWVCFDAADETEAKLSAIRTIADTAYRWDRFSAIIERLDRQRRVSQDAWVPTLCLAEAYRQVQDFTKAREHLAMLVAQRPRDAVLLGQVYRLAKAEGQHDEALRRLEELAALEPSRQNLSDLADTYLAADRRDESLRIWMQLASTADNKADELARIAANLMKNQFNDKAADLLAKAYATNPGDWQTAYLYATALQNADRTDKADAIYVAITDLPDPPPSAKPAAPASASKNQSRTGSRYSGMPPELVRMQQMQMIRYQLTNPSYRQAMGGGGAFYTPQSLEEARLAAWHQHTEIARKADKFDALVEQLEAQRTAASYWRLVQMHSDERGRPARRYLEELIKIAPNDIGARVYWLMTNINTNNAEQLPLDQARKLFTEISQASPELANNMKSYWVYYLKQTNQQEELTRYGKELAASDYSEPNAMFTAISTLAEIEQFNSAIELLRQARTKFPGSFQSSRAGGYMSGGYIYQRLALQTLNARRDRQATDLMLEYLRASRPSNNRVMTFSSTNVAMRYGGPDAAFPCATSYFDESRLDALYRFQGTARGTISRDGQSMTLINPNATKPGAQTAPAGDTGAFALLKDALKAQASGKDEDDRLYASLALSYLAYWANQKEEAAHHLSDAFALRPWDISLALSLAQLRCSLGDKSAAVKIIAPLQQRYHPLYKHVQQLALQIARDLKDDEAAKTAALRLFNMQLSAQEQVQLASTLHELGLTKKAEQLEQRVAALSANDLNQLMQLMQRHQQRGARKEAAGIAKQILRGLASSAALGGNEGVYRTAALQALRNTGELSAMIAAAEKQRAENPKSMRVLTDLWNYYAADGDLKKSREAIDAALALRPDDMGLRYQFAQSLLRTGPADLAMQQLRIVFEKDPARALASGNLIEFIYSGRQNENGARLARMMLTLDWDKLLKAAGPQSEDFIHTLHTAAESLARDNNPDSQRFLDKLSDLTLSREGFQASRTIRLRADYMSGDKKARNANPVLAAPSEDRLLANRWAAFRYMTACCVGFEGFTPAAAASMPADALTSPLGVRTRPVSLMHGGGWAHPGGQIVSHPGDVLLRLARQLNQLESMRNHLEKVCSEKNAPPDAHFWLALVALELKNHDLARQATESYLTAAKHRGIDSALAFLTQAIETRSDLIDLAIKGNEALVAGSSNQRSDAIVGMVYCRLARCYAKANNRDKARELLMRLMEMPSPGYGGSSYASYEKQQRLLAAGQGLHQAGFYREAYDVLKKVASVSNSQYGDHYQQQARQLAEQIRREHPELGSQIRAIAVPLSDKRVQVLWTVMIDPAYTGGREGNALAMTPLPQLFADCRLEIQASTVRGTQYYVLATVPAEKQNHVLDGVLPTGKVYYLRVRLLDRDGKTISASAPVPAAAGTNLFVDGDIESAPPGSISAEASTTAKWTLADADGKATVGAAVIDGARAFSPGGKRMIRVDSKAAAVFVAPARAPADPNASYLVGAWMRTLWGKSGPRRYATDLNGKPLAQFEMGSIAPYPYWQCWTQRLSLDEKLVPKTPMEVLRGNLANTTPPFQEAMTLGLSAKGLALLDDVFAVKVQDGVDTDLTSFPAAKEIENDGPAADAFAQRLPPMFSGVIGTDAPSPTRAKVAGATIADAIIRITYRAEGGQARELRTEKPSKSFDLELKDLQPATRYFIDVEACAGTNCVQATGFEVTTHSADALEALVIDNDSPQVSYTGDWASGTSADEKYGRDYRFAAAIPPGKSVTYVPELPHSGAYEVSAWWPAGANRTQSARYVVRHADGTSEVRMNQRERGGQWNPLGTYRFEAGKAGSVTLGCESDTTIADAIRWTPGKHANTQPAATRPAGEANAGK